MKNNFLIHMFALYGFAVLFDGIFVTIPIQSYIVLGALLALFARFPICVLWSIGVAILLDGSMIYPPGVFFAAFIITMMAMRLSVTHFITHTSLYSLILLVPFGTLIFKGSTFLFIQILSRMKFEQFYIASDIVAILLTAIYNTIATVIIFFIFQRIRKKLHAVFIPRS